MKLRLAICCLLFVTSVQAQMYRWVDDDGVIHFSDKPPPTKYLPKQHDVRETEHDAAGLGYALSKAQKSFPVTLYTGKDCAPCENGRAMLKKRGIPFVEKTVSTNDDIAKLKEAGGGRELPFLRVGYQSSTGFIEHEWAAMLTAAGYPPSSQLPATYRYPEPKPAASAAAREEPPAATPEAPAPFTPPPPPAGNAPPGFRF
jgi:glutaredoxin